MDKKLVVVESPAKARTINKILGPEFVVKASMGHVRDLPVDRLGVDIADGFAPEYEVVKGREKVVKELAEAAARSSAVFLAPDPDREGEAIAWHLRAVLQDRVAPERFRRVTYNEITPRAVREAFERPGDIDQNKVDAQQARRVLDRLVGYKVSPLLWRRIRRGLSAGRVQSVALRLICEREQAIRGFVPEAYWLIGARVRKQCPPLDPFAVRLVRIGEKKAEIKSAERAEEVRRDLEGRRLRVREVLRRELSRKPGPPFITSSLQQAGSRLFDFSPDRTMRIAQKLYEGVDLGQGPVGLVTYMRTDSFNLSSEAVEACRQLIGREFGAEYVPEKPHYFRSRRGAQEAHEAIRPTDVHRTPERLAGRLTPEQLKLYGIIWKRFVASQMAPARIAQRTAEIETEPREGEQAAAYLFRATASQVAFPGYLRVYGTESAGAAGDEKDKREGGENGEEPEVEQLPPLEPGEPLDVLQWLSDRKETQPPNRYSEATLVRALEENGVGRPSTYAQILATLHQRRYVTKEKRALVPTELGVQVNALLVEHLNELFDVKFTAGMEEALDEVEKGSVTWTGMLADFHTRFAAWMAQARGPAGDPVKARRLLELAAKVETWKPEVQHGKRVFNDRKFVESIRRQVDQGQRALSQRQVEALGRVVLRYREQVPEAPRVIAELGLDRALEARPVGPPTPSTVRKLALLAPVRFDPPVERRGRTFDERGFVESLRSQVEAGRSLSPAQIRVLDRLVLKHAGQIEGFESMRGELELDHPPPAADPQILALIEALRSVTAWAPPVSRGHRVLDDRKFYESLARHHATRHTLTPRQVAALRRLVRKYQARGAAPAERRREDAPAAGEGDHAGRAPDRG